MGISTEGGSSGVAGADMGGMLAKCDLCTPRKMGRYDNESWTHSPGVAECQQLSVVCAMGDQGTSGYVIWTDKRATGAPVAVWTSLATVCHVWDGGRASLP